MAEQEIQYPSVIHKQSLELKDDDQTLQLPNTAEILSIQMQGGKICVWYQWYQHPANFTKTYDWIFRVIGTGHPFIDPGLKHLATVQDRQFVWHIFRRYGS